MQQLLVSSDFKKMEKKDRKVSGCFYYFLVFLDVKY